MVRFAAALVFVVTSAWACEPCPPGFDLKYPEIGKKADLVAILESDGKAAAQTNSGPEIIEYAVTKVLKGTAGKSLKARGWFGMCDYGLVLPKGTFVVFLGKEVRGVRETLNMGCGQKFLKAENGFVTVDGKKLKAENLK